MSNINISDEAYKAIYAAIEQVYEQTSKKPTYSQIQKIYKTSNSYIKVVLADWLDKNESNFATNEVAESADIKLSDETIAAISHSFLNEIKEAKRLAANDLELERIKIYEVRDEALSELDEQMKIADERFDEINSLTALNKQHLQKIADLDQQNKDLIIERDDLKAENVRKTDDAKRLQDRIDEVETELTETRKTLSTSQAQLESATMRYDEAMKRNERLQVEYDDTNKRQKLDIADRTKQIADLRDQHRNEIAEIESARKKTNDELLDSQRQLAKAQGDNESLQRTIDELRAATTKPKTTRSTKAKTE
ncbi:hypothetical protein [uncultured Psychrobacter sp.]|uniref:hypothetical protein n=1 Tax=uncultured Psychrobacter sp. TaxID=259303 RepID=UPI00262006FD|nr:hypothetical protein [uncultured Psychrobacter sp.]